MPAYDLDVLVFGGGVAGLWTLARLRAQGYSAALVEARQLGTGQSIQAQGIIHGGGKYALRGVGDLASARSIRDMPARWLAHHAGERAPDLSAAQLLSDHCLMWSPSSWADSAVLGLVSRSGLLSTRPRPLPPSDWPPLLREGSRRVERMDEPVFSTQSVLSALAAPHQDRIRQIEAASVEFLRTHERITGVRVTTADGVVELRPRAVVLAAGQGNEELLTRCDGPSTAMQRRPLRMVMLRGALPQLFGHCVAGGKTRITVTSASHEGDVVWQLGGEIAERLAGETDEDVIRGATREDLGRCLPALDLSELRVASYAAVRAEAKDGEGRRPSGVHVSEFAANAWVAWPTKLALAPLLADDLVEQVRDRLGSPQAAEAPLWPAPAVPVARYPWEEARWSAVL